MKRSPYRQFLLAVATALALTPVLAVEPLPITADEAFDAAATGTDPLTGEEAKVALVDVRSRAEYFWVGTPVKVLEIVLKGRETRPIQPDAGKVRLIHEGKFLEYRVKGRYQRVQVDEVASRKTQTLAKSIPYQLWNESEAKLVLNPAFSAGIEQLADADGVEVLIVYCRSGARSTACINNPAILAPDIAAKFQAIYEIDDPMGAVGVGGFEGSFYGQAYNGYLGFPGRQTEVQDAPSVSWKDSGLPIAIGVRP